jgi:predicted DsbA family dithiol-disulfide isomerase
MPAQGSPLRIDVVSDVVCPWCFIGKRQLEQALAQWRAAHPEEDPPLVVWRSFQLNPDMPHEGMERSDYLLNKFGRSDVSALYANVVRAAEAVGLTLNLSAIARQPNTLKAHALVHAAGQIDPATADRETQGGPMRAASRQDQMVERIFEAYFIEGQDLTDPQQLRNLGLAAGLAHAQVEAALGDEALQAVARDDEQARDAGIQGVPFFIVNQRFAVSGAQGAQRLLALLEQAHEASQTTQAS